MFYYPYLAALALSACLVTGMPRSVQAQSWVREGQTPAQWAERLAAQRQEIEEIKVIFLRIDRRVIQIDKIHQQMERILTNPEATSACAALEDIQRTRAKLATEIETARTEQERAELKNDADHYAAVFKRAQTAYKQFACRE